MDKNINDPLKKYFEAAKSGPLVASFDEVRLNFEINVVNKPVSFLDHLRLFLSQRINLLYTLFGAVLIGLLFILDFDNELTYLQVSASGSRDAENITAVQFEEKETPTDQNDFHKEDNFQVKAEQFNNEKIQRTEPENSAEEKQNMAKNQPLVEKKQVMEPISNTDENFTNNDTITTSKITAPSESSVNSEPAMKRPVTKIKPPFNYTFTPNTPETTLRKLQQDLSFENINLKFSKLKYKDGTIQRIEGTIELDGFFATFTTNEFEEFTFTWSYTKYNSPEKFDIIINTPMQRKSNTAIHIDIIE